MNLIVIEGLDGSGKSTQIKLLQEYFDRNKLPSRFLHFPRTDSPFFGELIKRFLKGELGRLEDVNPWLVAMIYAGDRRDASSEMKKWLESGQTVLLDRYVYSNIAYQCAKIEDREEKNKLRSWIIDLEFKHFGIPRPDLNIFLDVPLEFTRSNLVGKRTGSDRKYLEGNSDIHENSLEFQENVRQMYLETAKLDNTLNIIDCSEPGGSILNPNDISKKIIQMLTSKKFIR